MIMKTKLQYIIAVFLVCITTISFAQVSILNNVRPVGPPWSLGWNGAGLFPGSLEIRNDFVLPPQPINFFTNLFQRMTILGTNGNVGIGTPTPQTLQHLYSAGATSVYSLYSNLGFAGPPATGFEIGIATTGNAELRQIQNLPLQFFTNNAERMRIAADGSTGINFTNPQLTNANNTGAQLHLEGPMNFHSTAQGGLSNGRWTVLYSNTSENGNPVTGPGDGFRIRYQNDFFTGSFSHNDALVIEKTDYNPGTGSNYVNNNFGVWGLTQGNARQSYGGFFSEFG